MSHLTAAMVAPKVLTVWPADRFAAWNFAQASTSYPAVSLIVFVPRSGVEQSTDCDKCREMVVGSIGGLNPEPINGRELTATDYSEAGLVSGIFTRAIIQPLDVLKIRFQLQEEPIRGSHRGKYTSVYQSIKTVYREEGFAAFWKGQHSFSTVVYSKSVNILLTKHFF
jgi:hypothetical protein